MVGALYRNNQNKPPLRPPFNFGVHPPPIPSQNAILKNLYSGGRPVLILILSAMRNANSNA
jgi:hypothetical protein